MSEQQGPMFEHPPLEETPCSFCGLVSNGFAFREAITDLAFVALSFEGDPIVFTGDKPSS